MIPGHARRISFAPVLFLSLPCLTCSHASFDSIHGRWEGFASFGERRMEMAIDFSTSHDGPAARLTVPQERVLSKRLHDLEIDLPAVSFSIPLADQQAPFRGTVRADTLVGTVSLGEEAMRIRLVRKGASPEPPYHEEEIEFTNGDLRLRGSLLMPPNRGPHPAIILIHGSSTPDRDDFRFYADRFVRNGIAAVIYDKRSTGGQSGGMSQVDLRDLAGDVVAAVSLLRQRTDIDPNRIGLWGFSQGGWVAPIAASQLDSVAFVVGVSAPGVTYADVDKFANAAHVRNAGFGDGDVDQAMAALTRVDHFVRNGGNAAELQSFLDSAHRNRWARYTTLPRVAPTPEHIRSWLRWRNLDLDPIDYWRTVRAPVLLMYGERDDAVPVHVSARRIGHTLEQAGNTRVTIRIVPGEDHNISTSQEFLDEMVKWMVEQTSGRQ